MNLPYTRGELAKIEPCESDMQEGYLLEIYPAVLDKLVFQARSAIDLLEALELCKAEFKQTLVYLNTENPGNTFRLMNINGVQSALSRISAVMGEEGK